MIHVIVFIVSIMIVNIFIIIISIRNEIGGSGRGGGINTSKILTLLLLHKI